MQIARKVIRPHNMQNGIKLTPFLAPQGEELGASYPLSYHPRPKMRREEARKSEESSKEKKEQRKMGENGEGCGIFIELGSEWRHHEGEPHPHG